MSTRAAAAKLAFTDTVSELTYGELQPQSRRLANLLRRLGVRREERVAMIMLDTVDFPIVFLGAIRAGIVPVPLNTLLTAEQYAYVLADCRARVLFVSEALLPVRQGHARADAGSRACRGVRARMRTATRNSPTRLARESDSFATVATHRRRAGVLALFVGLDRHAQGRAASAFQSRRRRRRPMRKQVLGIREDDVCLSAAKLFFAYGLGNALTFPMSVGASTVLQSRAADAGGDVRADAQVQPDDLLRRADAVRRDAQRRDAEGRARAAPRLRICTSAGEALPEAVGNAWKARFGVDILDGVGSTELLHIFLSNAPGDIKYGSSGRPVPGYKVRLVNEAGADVPDGEVGELLVDAPSAGEGYWNQRSKSRQTFEGRWTRTGDKYIRDADGRYTFCGRSDDMFKVSGIWVSPFEVESALITHPAVLEAAVVPEADPEGLLKPKAFVVLRAGGKTDGLHRGAEGAREAEDRPVEISALDRRGGQPAEDRDGKDPAVQVAGRREIMKQTISMPAKQAISHRSLPPCGGGPGGG